MRYNYAQIKTRGDGKQVYKTLLLSPIPFSEDDIYIITDETMYLDGLAYTYYKNPELWFVIAQANSLGKGRLSVPPGIQLRIPKNPSNVLSQLNILNT